MYSHYIRKKCLNKTAQLWAMWREMPWDMYKCIAARQNKIYREEENKQAREKHKFQRKDKKSNAKVTYFKAHTHKNSLHEFKSSKIRSWTVKIEEKQRIVDLENQKEAINVIIEIRKLKNNTNQNTYLEERFETLENAYEGDKKFKVITEELIDMEDKKIHHKDIQHSWNEESDHRKTDVSKDIRNFFLKRRNHWISQRTHTQHTYNTHTLNGYDVHLKVMMTTTK